MHPGEQSHGRRGSEEGDREWAVSARDAKRHGCKFNALLKVTLLTSDKKIKKRVESAQWKTKRKCTMTHVQKSISYIS